MKRPASSRLWSLCWKIYKLVANLQVLSQIVLCAIFCNQGMQQFNCVWHGIAFASEPTSKAGRDMEVLMLLEDLTGIYA